MKYIVYLTKCLENNKIYIGVHQTNDPDVFDGYLANGVRVNVPSSYIAGKTPFQKAVVKYGTDQFIRSTIEVFDVPEQAYELERKLVNKEFLNRTDTYNIKLGGEGGCPEVLKRKVYMYDLDGNYECEFATVYECNKYFFPCATSGGHVPRAIKLGHQMMGHQLSYEKVPNMPKFIAKRGSHCPRRVGRFNDSGELVQEYESVRQCHESGYKNLSRALKLGIKTKGYYFKYI